MCPDTRASAYVSVYDLVCSVCATLYTVYFRAVNGCTLTFYEQIRKTVSVYMIRVCVQHVRVCAHVCECVRVYVRVCSKGFIL